MAPDKTIPMIYTEECGYVPTVLVNAGELIEKHITTKNLFQVQGSSAKVKQLLNILSLQKMPRLKKVHVHDVVEVIKVSLSRLSNEIIPEQVLNLLIEANQSQMTDYTAILTFFYRTSPMTFSAVHYVMRLLNKIMQQADSNGMNVRKLATIFVLDVLKSLTAFGTENQQESEELRFHQMERLPYLIMVIEQLILRVSAFKEASKDIYATQLRNNCILEKACKMEKESAMGDSLQVKPANVPRPISSLCSHLSQASSNQMTLPFYGTGEPAHQQTIVKRDGSGANIDTPAVKMDSSTVEMDTSTVKMDQYGVKMDRSTVKMGRPGVSIDRPAVNADRSAGKMGKFIVLNQSVVTKEKLTPKRKLAPPCKPQGVASKRPYHLNRRRPSVWKPTPAFKPKDPPAAKGSERKATKPEPPSTARLRTKKKKSPMNRWRPPPRWKGPLHHELAKEDPLHKKSPKRIIFYRKNKTAKPRKQRSPNKTDSKGPFHQDEELLPWSNIQSDTDDSSIMQRTMKGLHVHKASLASSPERSGRSLRSIHSLRVPVEMFAQVDTSPLHQSATGATGKVVCKQESTSVMKSDSTSLFNKLLEQPKSPPSRRSNSERLVSFAQRHPLLPSYCHLAARKKPLAKRTSRKTTPWRLKLDSLRLQQKRRRFQEGVACVILLGVTLLCAYILFLLLKMGDGQAVGCTQREDTEFLPLRVLGFCNEDYT